MARVKTIKSARASKIERKCATCGKSIEVGDTYKKVGLKTGPRSSIKRFWCATCQPKASQLTTNSRMSTLYGVQESLDAAIAHFNGDLGDLDDLKSQFESGADEAEAVADEYEEGADNMPENLQQGSQAEEMRNKATAIREWAETLRNVDWPEAPATDEIPCANCDESQEHATHDSASEDFDHDYEEPEDEEVDLSEAEAAIGELSL